MIKAIYQRDIEKILTCLKDLRILFGIQDIGIINFFESLMLLLNRKVQKISKESISRAIETFSNFLS